VIATKVGSIPQNIEHGINAILIDPGNVTNLYNAILDLINNKVTRQEIIESANILVGDCLSDIQVKKIIDYINA
jgi:glycosyltransferase involved in cell wall biosynthesis